MRIMRLQNPFSSLGSDTTDKQLCFDRHKLHIADIVYNIVYCRLAMSVIRNKVNVSIAILSKSPFKTNLLYQQDLFVKRNEKRVKVRLAYPHIVIDQRTETTTRANLECCSTTRANSENHSTDGIRYGITFFQYRDMILHVCEPAIQ